GKPPGRGEQVDNGAPQAAAGHWRHPDQDQHRARVLGGPVQLRGGDEQDQEDPQVGQEVHRIGEQEEAPAGVRREELDGAREDRNRRRQRHPGRRDVREVLVVLVVVLQGMGGQAGQLYASLAPSARNSRAQAAHSPARAVAAAVCEEGGAAARPSPSASAMTRKTSVLSMKPWTRSEPGPIASSTTSSMV